MNRLYWNFLAIGAAWRRFRVRPLLRYYWRTLKFRAWLVLWRIRYRLGMIDSGA
jgi:hypothetical protein